MKEKITLQQVTDEAATHEAIAALYRNIAESLKNIELLNSGSRIMPNQAAIKAEQARVNTAVPDQGSSTKLEILKQVLRNNSPKPMTKLLIADGMKKLGYETTEETIGSYLTRHKNKLFKNPKRGYWKLAELVPSVETTES
jgi:hypothetical protein